MAGIQDDKLKFWISRARASKDLSQGEFGKATGWAQATIQAWETGVRGVTRRGYQSLREWAIKSNAELPPEVDWSTAVEKRKGAADVQRRYLAKNVRQVQQGLKDVQHSAVGEVRAHVMRANPLLDEAWGGKVEGGPPGGPKMFYNCEFLTRNLAAAIVVLPDNPNAILDVRRSHRERLWDLLRIRQITGLEQGALIYLMLGAAELYPQVKAVTEAADHDARQHGLAVHVFDETANAAEFLVLHS